MYKLSLRKIDGSGILLHGPDLLEPVRGARRSPAPRVAGDNLVEEEIFVDLKGGDIRTWLYQLEAWLALARSREQEISLQIQAAGREEPLASRVLDGRIELLGQGTVDRMHGFQGLRLYLLRENNWNEPGHLLPLYNHNGAGVWEGLAICNDCDETTGRQNYVDVLPADLPGSLPAPAILMFDLGGSPGGRLRDVVVAAGADLKDAGWTFDHVLQGELAEPGSGLSRDETLSSTGYSRGACRRVEWLSDQETQLLSWQLDSTRLGYAAGRAFRPALRLDPAPATDLFLRWKLCSVDGSQVLEQTGQACVAAGCPLGLCPALNLPPLSLVEGSYGPLRLELWGESPDPAGRRICLDFVHLLPVEQWAVLRAGSGSSQGQQLVLDGQRGLAYTSEPGGENQSFSHTLIGQPPALSPGRPNRVYFLFTTEAGMPLEDSLDVRIAYGARYATP